MGERTLGEVVVGVSMNRSAIVKVLGGGLLAAAGILSTSAVPAAAQTNEPPMKLKIGDTAPNFKLQYFDGHDLKNVSLSDYHGKKNVVLAFYVFALTGG